MIIRMQFIDMVYAFMLLQIDIIEGGVFFQNTVIYSYKRKSVIIFKYYFKDERFYGIGVSLQEGLAGNRKWRQAMAECRCFLMQSP